MIRCEICQKEIDPYLDLTLPAQRDIYDICESCYLDKEVKDSEKHLKGYDETKADYLASIDSEGYQGVWGGGRHGF